MSRGNKIFLFIGRLVLVAEFALLIAYLLNWVAAFSSKATFTPFVGTLVSYAFAVWRAGSWIFAVGPILALLLVLKFGRKDRTTAMVMTFIPFVLSASSTMFQWITRRESVMSAVYTVVMGVFLYIIERHHRAWLWIILGIVSGGILGYIFGGILAQTAL